MKVNPPNLQSESEIEECKRPNSIQSNLKLESEAKCKRILAEGKEEVKLSYQLNNYMKKTQHKHEENKYSAK